jgi:galactokinase
LSDFRSLFGRSPALTVDAPGRVNLIGEHTDYNGGFVLPTAIPQRTQVELAPRPDNRFRVRSSQITNQKEPVEYTLGAEAPGRDWLDYVQGITLLLRQDGHRLSGFDVCISSTVPIGSGLSSSAALEVSLLRALRLAFQLPLDDIQLARLGQRAENEFVGAQCGIMDQMAAVFADDRHALFLDARTLQFQRVPLPAGADLVVINSGVAHDLTLGDYNTRRAECEQACRILGVSQLRDLQGAGQECLDRLPEPLKRRARHVLTENERVLQAVDAMRQEDLPRLGRLFVESHRSMREDYQVSVPEIDLLVELAHNQAEVYGARLTGGGFGGSVVVLARAGMGAAVAQQLARSYSERSGRTPTVLVPTGIG